MPNAGSRRNANSPWRQEEKPVGHLSNSADRDELIRLGVCVACRGRHAANSQFCHVCMTQFANADRKAFAGYFREIRMVQG